MYTNADVTLYLYNKEGKAERYTRMPIERVYWEDVRQSTYLKTGQRDGTSVLLVIPLVSLDGPIKLTQGKDLAVNGIIEDRAPKSGRPVENSGRGDGVYLFYIGLSACRGRCLAP